MLDGAFGNRFDKLCELFTSIEVIVRSKKHSHLGVPLRYVEILSFRFYANGKHHAAVHSIDFGFGPDRSDLTKMGIDPLSDLGPRHSNCSFERGWSPLEWTSHVVSSPNHVSPGVPA